MEDVLYLREHGEEQRYVFSVYSETRDLTRHPDPQEYVVQFDQPFKNVVGLDVVEALIPRSQYLIDVHNNTLLFTQTGTRLEVRVPIGEYDRTTLLAAMNQVLNPHGIRARFQSRERSVIEFASARVFKLDVLRSSMARFLGFRMQQDYVNFTLVRGPSERPEITQAVALYWKNPKQPHAETHGDVLFDENGIATFPIEPQPDTRTVLDADVLAFAFTLPQPFQLPEDFRYPRYRTVLESSRATVAVGPRSVRVRLFRPFDPREDEPGEWTVPTEPWVPVLDGNTATYVFHRTTEPFGNSTWGELVPSDPSVDPDAWFGGDSVTESGLRITYVDHPLEWTSERAYNHVENAQSPTPVSFRMHWTYAPTVGTLPLFRYGTAESFLGLSISDGKAIYERRNTVDVTRTSTLSLRDPVNVLDSGVEGNERYVPTLLVPVMALYVQVPSGTIPNTPVIVEAADHTTWTGTWDGARVVVRDDGPVSLRDIEGPLTVVDASPTSTFPFVIHHLQLRTKTRIAIPPVGALVTVGFGAEERTVVVCNAALSETGENTNLDVAFPTDRFTTNLLPDRIVVGDRVVPLASALFFLGTRQFVSVYADRSQWTDLDLAELTARVTGVSVDGTEGFAFVANAVRFEPLSPNLIRIDLMVQIGANDWPGLQTDAFLLVGGHAPLPLLVDPFEALQDRAFLVSYGWELEGRAYTRFADRPKPDFELPKQGALRQSAFRVPVQLDSVGLTTGTDSLDGTPIDAWTWYVALDAWDPRLDLLLDNRLALEGRLDVSITTQEPQIRRRLLVPHLDPQTRYESRLWIDTQGTVHVQIGNVYESDPMDAFETLEGLQEARIRVPLGSDLYASGHDTIRLETIQARLSATFQAPMNLVARPFIPSAVTGTYVVVIQGTSREVVPWADFDPQAYPPDSITLVYALVRPNQGGRGYLDRVWDHVPVQRKHAVAIFSNGEVWIRNGLTNERVTYAADLYPPQSLLFTPWFKLGPLGQVVEDLTVATGPYVRTFWDELFDSSDRSLFVYSQPASDLGNKYQWNLIPSSTWSIVRIGEVSQRFVLDETSEPSVLQSITLFLADTTFAEQQIPLRVQLLDALGNLLDEFLELVVPQTPTDRIQFSSDDELESSVPYGFPNLNSITFSFDRYKTGSHIEILPGVPYTVAISFNFPDSGSLAFETPVFPPTTDFLGTVRALLPTGRFQDQRGYVPMRLITERLEHRITSPGITMMTSGTFVKLSVPEIESYAYQHQNYDDRAPGIASFFLAKEFEHQWFEFPHTSSTKDLRVPIASVDRLTLRFLTETDEPYQFRGVDHILKLAITFLVPRVNLNFPSRLAPHYAPGRILFANSRDTDADGDGPVDIRPYDPTDDLERRHDLDTPMVRRGET